MNHQVEDCNPFLKSVRFRLFEIPTGSADETEYSLGGADNTLTINWGDGSTEVIAEYDGAVVEHEYLSEGSFEASASLTFTDLYGDTQTIFEGVNAPTGTPLNFNTEFACTHFDFSKEGWAQSGDWKLAGKIWVNDNFFGNHIGSYTHAWKNVNGTWKRRSASIWTQVSGDFRDLACEVSANKSGSKTQNSRRVRKVKSKGIFRKYIFGNGDVFSNHTLSKNGVSLSLNLVLNPC